MKSKAGALLEKTASPKESRLWCFHLFLPLCFSCPAVMLITVLSFTVLFLPPLPAAGSVCSASETDCLEIFCCFFFPFSFFLLFYVDCFLLNALNSSDAFVWKEIRSMWWPYVYKPVQPSPTKYAWKTEFEENEISAGPRIWLLCSREGIKVIRTDNESQMVKRKVEEKWFLSFSRRRDQTISYISIISLPLFQFLSLFYCGAAQISAGLFCSCQQSSVDFLPYRNWLRIIES